MSPPLKRALLLIGGAIGFVALVALVVPWLVSGNRYKHRLEAAATEALGMDVRIGGRLGIGFFPGFHVTARDGRILDEQGVVVASAKKVRFGVELLPLLHHQFRLRKIELTQPRLSIERDSAGTLNVERLKKAVALLGALDGGSVSLSDGTLLYVDGRSGARIEATDFDLVMSHIRLASDQNRGIVSGLSFEGNLACGRILTKDLSLSELKASLEGKDGVLQLEPVTMKIFGGQMAGTIQANLSDSIPVCRIHCSLPRFRIEEFLATLSPKKAVEGAMDFSASLTMRGENMRQMVQTAAGEVTLRGENLVLAGNDLDGNLSRFESSQNFNLVDVGAVFFAGPLGLAVTKGYNFAGLFQGSGGSSRIRTLVSDWKVERGVARAKDVAMATAKNRLALQGGLDFVNAQFADVTVAVIDAKGCAKVRQVIHGPFAKPVVEKPNSLTSLAGPVLGLLKKTTKLLPAGPCKVFYSGSVAAPK